MLASGQNVKNNTLLVTARGAFLAVAFGVCSMYGANAASDYNGDIQIKEEFPAKDAVMVIRFNQQNIYFQNALKKMVEAVSKNKPNATYDLQSIIPSNRQDIGNKYKNYNNNLRLVVGELSNLGISIDKIRVDITDSNYIDDQEIRIFIN